MISLKNLLSDIMQNITNYCHPAAKCELAAEILAPISRIQMKYCFDHCGRCSMLVTGCWPLVKGIKPLTPSQPVKLS